MATTLDRIATLAPAPTLELSAAAQQKWLNEAAEMGEKRCKDYDLYEEFYRGDHRTRLRDRARRYLEEAHGVPFAENFTQPAVDVLAERLQVIGFQSSEAQETVVEGKKTTVDEFGRVCEEWWQRCRMDAVQGRVHRGMLKRGEDFLIVDWDAATGYPVFARQRPHQIKVVYSDDHADTIAYAVKRWATTTVSRWANPSGDRITRLNVYWPGKIEKWFQTASGGEWQRWYDDDETSSEPPSWPTWWTTTGDMSGEPLGVAVVHFRNMPGDDGNGVSRVRQAIPFQAELNKNVADLQDLIDNHALPQDYVTGAGGEVNLERFAGVWKAADVGAQFGRLEASDTAYLLNAIEGVLSRMARRLRIPMHLLTGGTPPSGEALKTSESGLVATAAACQVETGDAWENAMLLALRLAASFPPADGESPVAPLPAGFMLETQWKNPQIRSDMEDLQVASQKKQLGVSTHTLLGELGYDADEEARLRLAEEQAKADVQASVFDRGGIPV